MINISSLSFLLLSVVAATICLGQEFPPGSGGGGGGFPSDSGSMPYPPGSGSGSDSYGPSGGGSSFLPPKGSGSSQPDFSGSSQPFSSGSWSSEGGGSSQGSGSHNHPTPAPPTAPPKPTVIPSFIPTEGEATFVAPTSMGIFYQCTKCFGFIDDKVKSFIIDRNGQTVFRSYSMPACQKSFNRDSSSSPYISDFAICGGNNSKTSSGTPALPYNLTSGETVFHSAFPDPLFLDSLSGLLRTDDFAGVSAIRVMRQCSHPSSDVYSASFVVTSWSLVANPPSSDIASYNFNCTNGTVDPTCAAFVAGDLGCDSVSVGSSTTEKLTNYIYSSTVSSSSSKGRKSRRSFAASSSSDAKWTILIPTASTRVRGISAIIFTQFGTTSLLKHTIPEIASSLSSSTPLNQNVAVGQSDATIVIATKLGNMYGFIDETAFWSNTATATTKTQTVNVLNSPLWKLNLHSKDRGLPAVFDTLPVFAQNGLIYWTVGNQLFAVDASFGESFWRSPFKSRVRGDVFSLPTIAMTSSTSSGSQNLVLVAGQNGLNLVGASSGSIARFVAYTAASGTNSKTTLTPASANSLPMCLIGTEIFIPLSNGIFVMSL